MTISRKIGLHIINGTALPLGRPAVVKIVDASVTYYRQVRAEVGTDCLIVVRWHQDTQPLDEPAANALAWFRAHEAWIKALPVGERVVYEGYNEIGDEQAGAYAIFERARLQLLHDIERHGCVGNWSVGCPDLTTWPLYSPALTAMNDGDVAGLHEYHSDRADLENVWHIRRFTIPTVAAHLAGKRIVITECGRDRVENQGAAGWQHTTDAGGYMADLRRLGELYDGCPSVIGATVYQTGSIDPKWRPFEAEPVWPAVVAEYDTAPTVVPAPEPAPAPAPALVLAPPIDRANIVRITQRFTPPSHYGIDYSCYEGTPVFASCDGIAYRGQQASGFGLYVRIEDGAGLYVYAAHLRAWAVPDGSVVQAGDVIGYSGNTGNSTGPHLHYEVRRAAPGAPRPTSAQGAIDPEPLLYWPEDAAPEPTPEPVPEPTPWLPSNDPYILEAIETGDPYQMHQKARWCHEEAVRRLEGGDHDGALAILRDMVQAAGLMYEIERALAP